LGAREAGSAALLSPSSSRSSGARRCPTMSCR
jgi:hypothetical protein